MSTSNVIQLPRPEPRTRTEPVAVLDVGTSKMCCLIARRRGDRLELQGGGYQLAEGLRAGAIVDAEAAEASILAVVHEAEQQAGRTVRQIVLGISGGRPESVMTTIDIELGGRAVGPADLTHALALARAQARTDGAEILHALPVEITLDSSQGLRDARGMVGERLRITVHLVRVASAALYNLVAAIERCHLDVAAVVAAPYAAGLASLSEDEATSGALVLDLGAGVTGVARFADRRLQQLASLPLGAQHVTQDLAFGLSTGRAQAERLKTLYGGVLARAGDARQQLEVPGLGDPMRTAGADRVTRAPDRDHPAPHRGDIPAGARAHAPRPAAARRPSPGVDRRRQPARRASSSWPRRPSACRRGSAAPARSMPAPCMT